MKFVCENCSSEYSIEDAGVRGKVLKIRCGVCGHIIDLSDPELDEAAKRFAMSKEKKEVDKAQWFMAIDRMPVGPVSARSVSAYRRAGRISNASLVWKEGMPDWTALSGCKDLIDLFSVLDGETGSAEADDFGSPEFFEKARGAAAKRIGGSAPPTHSPSPERSKVRNRAVVPVSVGFFAAALAVFGVVLFGGFGETVTVYVDRIVYRDRIVKEYARVPSLSGVAEEKDKSDEAARLTRLPAEETATAGSRSARSAKQQDRAEQDTEKAERLMAQLGLSSPAASGAPVGGKPERQTGVESQQKGEMTESQLQDVVNRNKSGLKLCYERALKQGEAPDNKDLRVNFKFDVGAGGTVRNVRLSGEGSRIPSMKECLEQSVKRWVFPSSEKGSPVEFPFLFTPK